MSKHLGVDRSQNMIFLSDLSLKVCVLFTGYFKQDNTIFSLLPTESESLY